MKYTIGKIAEIVSGHAFLRSPESEIEDLVIDSRKIIFPQTSLFFAIKGPHNDGHRFLNEVYEQGVKNFIIERDPDFNPGDNINYIIVQNAIEALQQIAAFHRRQYDLPVIGITGSNGKTITKEWLHQMLSPEYNIIRSPKSFNSQVGVPLSAWQINEAHDLAIFEAGISTSHEMEKLANILNPSLGIFTNIGDAHSEGFKNIDEKIDEKLQLFQNSDTVIYCRDQDLVAEKIEKLPCSKFSWGNSAKADIQIVDQKGKDFSTHFEIRYKDNRYSLEMPFLDKSSLENAFHCVATMIFLEYDIYTITARIANLSTLPLRLELKEALNNCTLIYDCYNSDLNSVKIALEFLDQQHQHQKKTVILSDILQSGKNADELYTEVGKLIAKKKINRFIGIGKNISEYPQAFRLSGAEEYFYPDTASFLKDIDHLIFTNESILLKGARPFEFEKIGSYLEAKEHDTVLEINMNAIAHNLNIFKKHLNPGVKLMVMVKAFGYGTGSFELSNLLQFHRVDYLSVAYTDEGVELRKAGIKLPIMILNPEANHFDNIVKYKLEPEIYSFRILNNYLSAVESIENGSLIAPPVHLKIDTGMHRLGFEENHITELVDFLSKHQNITVASIFSHLSGSESARHDEFTTSQFQKFESICDRISKALGYSPMRHILNSSGIIRFPEYQYEMVRLGIGLYGIDPSDTAQDHLLPISTLKTIISQIKDVPEQGSIGYDRKAIAAHPMRIATVGIGYADGLSRHLSNGLGKMLIQGQLAPIIGNICMDMTMLDITAIPEAEEGDEVIVFGKGLPIQQLAEWDNTIPYEILTRISKRVKRVYFEE